MMLTEQQIKRQDFVDNSIFELLQKLNMSGNEIEWDIEIIADIREQIRFWLVDNLQLSDEMTFYPYIEE
ncbi:MAG: hypothetical protein J7K40_10070 [candidate division Zixibacteria bacterium]|nr:hypothetical protein [candidate division Zixibacteria bacterium]